MLDAAKNDKSLSRQEISAIVEKVGLIKKNGFGEVRVIIRNGCIYRIQTIEDEIIQKMTD